jgi:hypothetical protein
MRRRESFSVAPQQRSMSLLCGFPPMSLYSSRLLHITSRYGFSPLRAGIFFDDRRARSVMVQELDAANRKPKGRRVTSLISGT